MRTLVLLTLLAAAPTGLAAQGALAVQGFGYPTGQLGAGALAAGGGPAEIDPSSALNPATVGILARFAIYMQYEPEFRTTRLGSASDRSTSVRFPAFMVTGSIGRFTGGLAATTLLDRTWNNVYSDSQNVGGEWIPSTITAGSNGAITDVRAAGSWWFTPRVLVGAGVHALTGENRIRFGRSFPDSTGVGDVAQVSTISYGGRAVSVGAVLFPRDGIVIGASARFGGAMDARQDDLELGEATVPSRFGVTVAYTGIPNTTFSARYDRTNWSSMRDLGTAQLSVFDATEVGLGVEVLGPRIGGSASYARLGFRDRGLPFGLGDEQVGERALSGGFSLPLARGRGQIDLGLQRATRSAAGATEKAWNLSIGVGIRP